MKAKEVRGMRDDELTVALKKARTELFDLHSQRVTEKVEDSSKFSKLRKDVARMMTEQHARSRKKA